jgi:hypothetical protein
MCFDPNLDLTLVRYTPSTDTFDTNKPGTGNRYLSTVSMDDGRVLLIPSNTDTFGLYDPSSNTVTAGPSHSYGGSRVFRDGVQVSDGRVIMVPLREQSNNNLGVFDPSTDSFSTISIPASYTPVDPTDYLATVLLNSGKVLGVPRDETLPFIFDPSNDSFSEADSGSWPISYSSGSSPFILDAIKTPLGRVALLPDEDNPVPLTIYDPIKDEFTEEPIAPFDGSSGVDTADPRSIKSNGVSSIAFINPPTDDPKKLYRLDTSAPLNETNNAHSLEQSTAEIALFAVDSIKSNQTLEVGSYQLNQRLIVGPNPLIHQQATEGLGVEVRLGLAINSIEESQVLESTSLTKGAAARPLELFQSLYIGGSSIEIVGYQFNPNALLQSQTLEESEGTPISEVSYAILTISNQ